MLEIIYNVCKGVCFSDNISLSLTDKTAVIVMKRSRYVLMYVITSTGVCTSYVHTYVLNIYADKNCQIHQNYP